MTEPSQTMLTDRFAKASKKVGTLVSNGQLTFLALEDALQGLSLEQRLVIKRGLAQAALLP